ncbi:TrkH family potassium uptake protein [Desulfoprunum benzoelyticum]|uniref:Trk system potassium uptake protein TrkH n=1 Tax=Desulfoprunum benzoelyticum TaxID=1506996 RepID=A0A840UME8_9BACT|nr:TrkH family potassium uptake protein [Desulfoprunum benzoelyticum]MBB5346952.1 trk system potassium uptake protein TrkH [Desulfoprunum benzoelyticum]MBM9531030.1 TrkH family potassium uptake protein [Desulfoprunum benzoelyticum]
MRTSGVLNLLGKLLMLLSLTLIVPIPFSLYYDDGMLRSFVLSSLIGAGSGGLLLLLFPPEEDLGYREGFAIVTLSWLAMAFLGALPYTVSGEIPSFVDSYFEAMSGFTTTGSTILVTVEDLPNSLLFWRSLTQWLGGMGIIVLTIAVMPLLKVGGTQLFHAEMPGPTKDRLAPRIQGTARILWTVYVFFTLVETILLMAGGIGFFDAVCHSLTTLATGGFSTHTASIAYFESPYVEGVIIVFMLLAGINFTLHFHAMTGNFRTVFKNEELRFYLAIVFVSTLIITVAVTVADPVHDILGNFRDAMFIVASLVTTTGYGTADYDLWPPVCLMVIVVLMFIGGCAGSTSGGIKSVRILLLFKYALLQLRRLVHPHQVQTIKLGAIRVPQEILIAILGFFALYLVFFFLASIVVTATGVDILTGTSAVITTLSNVGPGFKIVGPTQNFSTLPELAKIILIVCMLAGRLELYTVVVLLTPVFWRMARKPSLRTFSLDNRQSGPAARITTSKDNLHE